MKKDDEKRIREDLKEDQKREKKSRLNKMAESAAKKNERRQNREVYDNEILQKPFFQLILGRGMGKALFYGLLSCILYDAFFLFSMNGRFDLTGQILIQALGQGLFFICLYFSLGQLWGPKKGLLYKWIPLALFGMGVLFHLSLLTSVLYTYGFLLNNLGVAFAAMLLGAFNLLTAVPVILMCMRTFYEMTGSEESFKTVFVRIFKAHARRVFYGWILLLLVIILFNSMLAGPMSFLSTPNPAILYNYLVTMGNPTAYFAALLAVYSSQPQGAFELLFLVFLVSLLLAWLWLIYARWSFTPKKSREEKRREKEEKNAAKSGRKMNSKNGRQN